jgi:preprotein translocase subunit SecF
MIWERFGQSLNYNSGKVPSMNKLQVQKQKKKMVGVITTIFLLSLAVLAGIQMRYQVTFAQGNNSEISEDESMMTMSSSSSQLEHRFLNRMQTGHF